MIDINKGKYWDFGWQLIDGCTPCSPGCDNCWSAAMTHTYQRSKAIGRDIKGEPIYTNQKRRFTGKIEVHPERLNKPLKRKKPAVYAIWNDLHHMMVDIGFREQAYNLMCSYEGCRQHTFLILTKRLYGMVKFLEWYTEGDKRMPDNIWHGLTVCNQQEADEKIPIFLQVPGKKFLSIEPMLSAIDLTQIDIGNGVTLDCLSGIPYDWDYAEYQPENKRDKIDAVILGGETGPKARPMNPDWVRSVRDQCEAAGVPFFLKSRGDYSWKALSKKEQERIENPFYGPGKKRYMRMIDGVTHDDLPWMNTSTVKN